MKEFDGPLIPFGTLFEYLPITANDKSRTHQFGKNAERMIVGLCTTCGKNEIGQATHWFAFFEDLQEAEATTKNVKQFQTKKCL